MTDTAGHYRIIHIKKIFFFAKTLLTFNIDMLYKLYPILKKI